jgi:Tol biopolymer transport system component
MLVIIAGLLLAFGAVALTIGSRLPKPLPAPFGVAANGAILYGAGDGDIYALDTATNVTRSLVMGPPIDTNPAFSPDGTKFVFGRVQPGLEPISTMVANADGTNIRPLTDRLSLAWFDWLEWSPDASALLVVGDVDGQNAMWTIGLDGFHQLLVSQLVGSDIERIDNPQWLPTGKEIVFVGASDTNGTAGLYVVGTDGTPPRAIIEPVPGTAGPAQPALSPDGTKVAFSQSTGGHSELSVVDIATGTVQSIAYDGTPDDRAPRWSPDGSSLLFERYTGESFRLAVGSMGGGPVTPIGPERAERDGVGADARFSPDGTRVLAYYAADRSSWNLGVADGSQVHLSTTITSPSTWQRVAR